ncbi:MAG: N-acetylglucosamine-6-phosphate deacetylase, partial [Georgenia sp.]
MTEVSVLRGRVVTPERVLEDGAVVRHGATIAWVGPTSEAAAAGHGPAVAATPARTGYVLPGLVDLHCHGTTTLLASLVAASPDTLRARVRLLADLADSGDIAGIHLEGPFLAAARCGAQDPVLLLAPDAGLTDDLLALGRGHVATMTLAPELVGSRGPGGVGARR